MKTVALVLLVAFAIAQPIAALAQKDKTYIRANTNDEALQRLAKEDSSRYWIAHVEALRIAREKGWPIEGLQYIGEDGRPLYYSTSNDAAAGLTRYEVENAFSLSLVRNRRIEPDAVWELKEGMLPGGEPALVPSQE